MNEFTFTFTVDELNTIVSALGGFPYAKSAPVIQKIEAIAQKQIDSHKQLQSEE